MADDRLRRAERAVAADPSDAGALATLERLRKRQQDIAIAEQEEALAALKASIKEPNRINLASGHPDLEEIARLDEQNMDYSFHLMQTWRHVPAGRVFWGEDSGCSCPAAFENDHFAFDGETLDTSLSELTAASRSAFISQVDGFPADYGDRMSYQSATLSA